jgi:hypothetical protein
MKRVVKFRPSFDRRSDDPKKNYGIGCAILVFAVIGEKGAASFQIGTGWYPGKGQRTGPSGYGIDYHSPVPQHEWHKEPSVSECEYLDGKPCYSDGTMLYSDEVLEVLILEGEEATWKRLEEFYENHFGKEAEASNDAG